MIRVMIVEDDPPTGALLMRMVKRTWSDVSVILEADPRSALEHWRTVGADLILLDWGLPRMSGLDLLKQIRRSDKKAVCVMITAYSDRDKVLAARACQVDAYITKPFDAKQVMASLSRIMTSHHEPSGSEVAEDSIDDFIKRQVTEGALGLPIDPDLVESIARIREMEADERINIMRRCQADSALLFRLLSLANSHHYMGGTDLVETFDAALRQIGVDGFINLAMELSLFAGSHLKQDFLKAKYLDCQRDAMSLIGVVSKLRQHLEFDVAACRSACLLYRVGELSLLQLMQAWIDDGHVLDEATCASVLSKNAARAGDQLQAQWTLPQPIRERIGAVELLPSGNVKREPIVMRIAGLLHAGDPHQELPRLMARFGLGGSKLGA